MNHPNHDALVRERRVCRADIELDALSHNLSLFQSYAGDAQIVAMVKANAYGHGAVTVARHLQKMGVKWFGVATVDEGIELRENGIDARILVMSGSGAQFFVHDLVAYGLTPLLSSIDEINMIRAQIEKGTSFPVHLDIDTGMTRGGFFHLDLKQLPLALGHLRVEGVSSHFAKAERKECAFTALQVSRFFDVLERLTAAGHKPEFIHLDKSASVLTQQRKELKDTQVLVRPGLGLYGVDPTLEKEFEIKLRPVLSWRTPVVLRKSVPEGTTIGYDCTFTTKAPSEVALVRVGYADGLNRGLSNVGHMVIGGVKVPILGRISMDLTVIDVTEVVKQVGAWACEVGSFAYIIGGEGNLTQSASDLALACGTIPYEVLTWISSRVERFTI